MTCRAYLCYVHLHSRSNALTGDLHQSELAERQDVMPCSVVCHQFAHVLVELLLMIFGVHVNVIDNDYTSNIPQAQLVNDLFCSQHVVVEGVLLLVGIHFLRAAVDIDREQRLGLVDDQVSAILETYCATETGLQLACDIVLVEYRLV